MTVSVNLSDSETRGLLIASKLLDEMQFDFVRVRVIRALVAKWLPNKILLDAPRLEAHQVIEVAHSGITTEDAVERLQR